MDRNKIASELTGEELMEFLDKCWKTSGLTLAKVQELAGGYGIAVSLMGAKSFRDVTFKRHLDRISKAGELAAQVNALRQAGAGHTIADAASAIISDEVLDRLVNRDADEELDLDVMSKIVKRLRDSDGRTRELELKIKAFEVREKERTERKREIAEKLSAAKTSKGGLTKDTITKIEQELGLL